MEVDNTNQSKEIKHLKDENLNLKVDCKWYENQLQTLKQYQEQTQQRQKPQHQYNKSRHNLVPVQQKQTTQRLINHSQPSMSNFHGEFSPNSPD
jgi:hypothetical protein